MSKEQRPLVIINNTAAKARRAWPAVSAKLEESGIIFDFYETTQPGDATTRTGAALKGGCGTIAIVGGDGTLSEAAEGFFEFNKEIEKLPAPINPQAALAVLPAGTGDDFARGLMGSRTPLANWIETFISYCKEPSTNTVRLVDELYGTCDNYTRPFLCLNASTMGIGGETAARVAAQGKFMRSLSGEARFMAATIGALAAWRERRVRVSLDEGTVIDCSMNLVAVANGLYAGAGMMLSPKAQIDDGKLDAVTACGLTRLAIIRELLRIHAGGHIANEGVGITQGRQVRIETFAAEDALLIEADGNVRGRTPVEFRVMPRSLRFVVS
jgi:diacylglycerol kinase (ATP)